MTNVDFVAVGKRLRDLRGERSQREMAALLGIAQCSLSNYERGKRKNLSMEFAARAAKTYKVTLGYIVEGKKGN